MADQTLADAQSGAQTEAAPEMPRPKGVVPYLSVAGRSAEASAFYQRAFGATETGRVPFDAHPGHLMHCQLEINGGALMMSDCAMEGGITGETSRAMTLLLDVEDGQAWWDRAVAAGCQVVMPLQEMFWGDLYGQLEDPFGIRWSINAPIRQG